MLKGHRRRIFKERRRQVRLAESLELLCQLRHLRLANHLAVYADPLPKLHEVR